MAEREGATLYQGDAALEKAIELLEEVGLPGGLLPMEDVIDGGHVRETGYVWINQKKAVTHLFKLAGKQVSYGKEIRGYLEKNRMRSLTGVFAKQLFIWAPIGDISVNDEKPDKISFKSVGGLGKTFPLKAFARGE